MFISDPLALVQAALPWLKAVGGRIINVTSDAAVEAYPGWGGYGSSKVAVPGLVALAEGDQPSARYRAQDLAVAR